MEYTTPYTPPTLTVDMVMFQIVSGVLQVVLIKRSDEPFKGLWALPGGYNASGETTLSALRRIVKTKAGIIIDKDLNYIEQLYTFDTIANDPRGHAVSVTYWGGGNNIKNTKGTNDTATFPVHHLPKLAYDHASIISYAHKRLIAKLSYTNVAYAFLPNEFTLSELQATYQAILGRTLDKRNFRKKFLGLNLIRESEKIKREGAHRPAKLYQFNKKQLEIVSRSI